MTSKHEFSKLGHLFITTAAFIIILAGVKFSSAILIPFILAIFLAMVADMPLSWLQGKGVPRWAGLIIVITVGLLIDILLIVFIGKSINNLTAAFPDYQQRLLISMQNMTSDLNKFGITIDQKMYDQVINYFDPGVILALLGRVFSGIGNIFSNGFMIFLTVVFILIEIPDMSVKLQRASQSSHNISSRIQRFTKTLKNYLRIKTATSLFTGVLISLWLSFTGVSFPIIWGFMAFILNFIPNIGSFIAAIPVILLALLQGGLRLGLMTTLGYLTINIVIGNMIEPKVMGHGLGLSTLVVFLSLIFWGWLLGPVGLLLCVPLTMFIKIAVEGDDDTGWLAVLLGNAEDLKQDAVKETT